MLKLALSAVLSCIPFVVSLPQELAPRAACAGNTATTRSQWCNYDINTNYYNTIPSTGVTRTYYFELRNVTLAPDGVPRTVLTVNGTVPGPTIYANWGDNIVVHVKNSLPNNGTSIHFHGVRQLNTNPSDGVASITQCPTAPGDSITYTWQAVQYGSSWYHSHFSLQAWEGVFGGIVVNGPASANYDVDLGNLFLQDWDHQTVDQLYQLAEVTAGPIEQDTGLINGTNVWGSGGKYFRTTFQSGKAYRLRLVNVGIDTFFQFSIDNHQLQVISMDWVPIKPYTTNVISIGHAQRYDVIVQANQASAGSAFWMRAQPDPSCSRINNTNGIKGIINYGSSTATPTTTAYSFPADLCQDEPSASLVPYLALNAGAADLQNDLDVTVAQGSDPTNAQYYKWFINNSTFFSPWGNPTSLQVLNGATTFNRSANVITMPTANQWMYLIVESPGIGAVHPIHLHGHDFWVLGAQANTSYAARTQALNTNNPPRRDVAMLPSAGYLVIAWPADNPGIWLTHCHIGWHQSEGLDLQFVERQSEIANLYNKATVQNTCNNWNAYMKANNVIEFDSGV